MDVARRLAPLWLPQHDTSVVAEDLHVMRGGPVGMHLPEHEHDALQIQANFTESIENGAQRFLINRPVSTTLIAPHQPHIGKWNDQTEVIVVLLSKSLLESTIDETIRSGSREVIGQRESQDDLIRCISGALRLDFFSGQIHDKTYLEAVGILLARHAVHRYSDNPNRYKLAGELSKRARLLALEYIEDHLNRPLYISQLAKHAGMGPQQFTSHFRRSVGYTPYQYLLLRRVERAKSFLRNTSLPIVQISAELCFVSQSHFTACFTRRTGMTPKRYRFGG